MKYNVHTHATSPFPNVVALVNQYPESVDASLSTFSVGIHPWYIDMDQFETRLALVDKYLQHPNCLALGECGLDKRIEVPFEIQVKVFKAQLLLAEKYKKAVVLHCVSAYQELIQIKREMNLTIPMVVHGFSKKEQVASSLLDHGFYLSFGKYLLRNPELSNTLKIVPLDRLFLETDTIAESIDIVYQRAEEILKVDLEPFIAANFNRIFKHNSQTAI